MNDANFQKRQLEFIFSAASMSPAFKRHPKYSVNEFADLLPYIAYNDVINRKFIIRGRQNIATGFDAEERAVIIQYSTIDELASDGWQLD